MRVRTPPSWNCFSKNEWKWRTTKIPGNNYNMSEEDKDIKMTAILQRQKLTKIFKRSYVSREKIPKNWKLVFNDIFWIEINKKKWIKINKKLIKNEWRWYEIRPNWSIPEVVGERIKQKKGYIPIPEPISLVEHSSFAKVLIINFSPFRFILFMKQSPYSFDNILVFIV